MLLNTYRAGDKNELVSTLSLFEAEPKFYIKMPDGENAPVFDLSICFYVSMAILHRGLCVHGQNVGRVYRV